MVLSLQLAGLALLVLVIGISAAAPADLPTTISFDPAIAAVLSQVTTGTLEYELAGLTGERPVLVAGSPYTIATRYTYQTQAISMATRYAYEQFASSGLSVTFHDYTASGYALRNVVAEKPGRLFPDEIYLVTAHLDDRPSGPVAPGADDNGSGSVAVMLAGRLLAPHDFAYTIRFVLFTGEEQGLYGSDAYAAGCAALGENIAGVVNLDMIGYNSDATPIIDLYAHPDVPASAELTDIFSDVIGLYGLNLVPHRFALSSGVIWASDQWSFLRRDYPAFLAIEDLDDFTPHYHATTDRVSTLDLDYYAESTRAGIATIAHLGRHLQKGVLSGTVSALDTGDPLPNALVETSAPAWEGPFTAPTDAGGRYTLTLPIGRYTVTVRSRSPGYYPAVITDVPIFSDTVTVRDVALEPWPHVYSFHLPWISRE